MVFLRAPRRGSVKTRLAATLGPDAALAIYHELLATTIRAVSPLDAVELRCTPDDATTEVASLVHPGWTVVPQGDGDLGDRLQRAFTEGFDAGMTRMAVIGTDCPEMKVDDIQSAWAGLEKAEVVLGPAADGGYWLIGLRGPQPALFQGIEWGTSHVLRQTLDRATAAGLRVELLRELSDVDTEEDWRTWSLEREA